MKTLWNTLSFLAVVHLLALALFVGWLWQSDRLDPDRIERVRAMFATTITAEQEAATQVDVDTAAQAEVDRLAALQANPPLPSDARIQQVGLANEEARQAVRRVQDETVQLRAQLEQRIAQLEASEAVFDARVQAWEQSIIDERDRRMDEQFQKTVKQYESLPPKSSRQLILELVQQPGGVDQAVAYLNAMSPRAASKILREFKTAEEVALATELLEKLRIFGFEAEAAELASHDDRNANAQSNAAAGG